MNGLEVIVKQNNKAAEEAIRTSGTNKYLVAEYAGLHAVDYSAYSTEEEANAAIAQINAKGPGVTAKLFVNK